MNAPLPKPLGLLHKCFIEMFFLSTRLENILLLRYRDWEDEERKTDFAE